MRKFNIISQGGLFNASTVTRFAKPSPRVSVESVERLSGSIDVATGSIDMSTFGDAFTSTQQLPIDWARFERHTFFDSAESKVNVTFDSIINFFPFDSGKEEINVFLNNLTGYERYIFDDLWPKSLGYLYFSGTQKGEDPAAGFSEKLGTYIDVTDQAGSLYPSISKRNDGQAVIDFSTSPFSIMFHLRLPAQSNGNAIIAQKKSNENHGFTIAVSSSASSTTADIVFMLSSGSFAMSASALFEKQDKFHHCALVFDRSAGENPRLKIFKDAALASTSSESVDMGTLNFLGDNLRIGSGSSHYLGTFSTLFDGETTFSGSIDDFRIYGSEKNTKQISNILSGNVSNEKSLLVYYKFNEPTGSFTNNNIVLDSSGNSLHSQIQNYQVSLRGTFDDIKDPVINEQKYYNPVLFPAQTDLVALNSRLLTSASIYDANNPNLITRMIPPHYLEDESIRQGFSNAKAGVGEEYSYTTSFPGGGKIGSPQLIASLLFVWAKFFDEIKLFTDQFGNLLTLDYDDNSTVADIMLPFLARYYGLDLPNMFSEATVQQFLRGQNITIDAKSTNESLAKIQAQIWRRILINIQDVIRSKGTVHAIKSLIRATGISPDNMFRFREFGGPEELTLLGTRGNRSEVSSLLFLSSGSQVVSPFLSGSRIEVGTPLPQGTFVEKSKYSPHGISNYVWDGLFTSGSWTVEFLARPNLPTFITTMSLGRVMTTGSMGSLTLANCIAVGTTEKTVKTGSLSVFHRPSTTADPIELILTGADIFDGNKWHIAFGRDMMNDTTASYFLRAGRQNFGKINEYYYNSVTASFGAGDYYQSGSTQINASGSFLQFGSGSMKTLAAGLNAASVSTHAKTLTYSGSIGRVRFWSKGLTFDEDKEHVRNFKSLGVENPLLNFNFVTVLTGAFERMRIDAQADQAVTQSSGAGAISIFDYSQNSFHLAGSGFKKSSQIINPAQFNFSTLDAKFDERSADNKIRIAGFTEDVNIEMFNTLKSPVRNIPLGTPIEDDTRFSVEISQVRALNDDIMLLLGTLEFFDDALGSPELLFASEYPNLESLRDVYFERLTDRVNYKNLLSFYKWIDESIGFFVSTLVPYNTSFLGMNFVIESHVLERSKLRYLQEDIYLGENDRRGLQTDLNLQQVVGIFKRY